MTNPGSFWIVCGGKTRDIHDGQVRCPGHGVLSASVCRDCRLVITIEDERDLWHACSVGESATTEPG